MGGARTRRQQNERLPLREQLPQRLVVSRIVTRAGLTPRAVRGGRSPARAPRGRARGTRPRGSRPWGGRRAPPLDEELVAVVGAHPVTRDRRAPGPRRDDADAVGLAAVRDHPPVVERGPVEAPVAGRRLALEVAAEPGLALGQEVHDEPIDARPAAAVRGWHRDDDAAVRVDHDAQPACAGRAAEGVGEFTAGQSRDRGDSVAETVAVAGIDVSRPPGGADRVGRRSRPRRGPQGGH